MKILFLIQKPNFGGLWNYILRLKNGIEKFLKIDVDVKIVDYMSDYSELLEYPFVHMFFTPFLNSKLSFFLLKTKKKRKTKIVSTYYNIKPENVYRRFVKKYLLPKLVDGIVVPSENMRNFYRKAIGYNGGIFVIKPIVPEKFFKIRKVNPNEYTYFGALRWDKGIRKFPIISKALKKLGKKFTVYGLVTEKDESILKFIKKIKNINLRLGTYDTVEILKKAKLCFFPYENLYNTFDYPLSLLEALASGTPVITSNVPLLPRANDFISFLDVWEVKQLTKKIVNLCTNWKTYSKVSKRAVLKLGVRDIDVINSYKLLLNSINKL